VKVNLHLVTVSAVLLVPELVVGWLVGWLSSYSLANQISWSVCHLLQRLVSI